MLIATDGDIAFTYEW